MWVEDLVLSFRGLVLGCVSGVLALAAVTRLASLFFSLDFALPLLGLSLSTVFVILASFLGALSCRTELRTGSLVSVIRSLQ
jgi:hypothetical protein